MVSFHLFGKCLVIEMSCSMYLIDSCPLEIHTSNISMKYYNTLVAWTLMMLFSEMLKFLKIDFFFLTNKTLWRKILNLHGILCFLKKLLFDRHLLNFPRYYNSYELLLTIISTKGIYFQFFDIKKLIDYQNIISKNIWIYIKKKKLKKKIQFFSSKNDKMCWEKKNIYFDGS
jgi:hypothetical protein